MRYFVEHAGVVAAITQPRFADLVATSAPGIRFLALIDSDAGEKPAPAELPAHLPFAELLQSAGPPLRGWGLFAVLRIVWLLSWLPLSCRACFLSGRRHVFSLRCSLQWPWSHLLVVLRVVSRCRSSESAGNNRRTIEHYLIIRTTIRLFAPMFSQTAGRATWRASPRTSA